MSIPTQEQYEARERALFQAQLAEAGKGMTREEKRHSEAGLRGTWILSPETFAERAHWLIYGNYGYGSYRVAREIVQRPRTNRVAALSQIMAALEYDVPARRTRALWHELTPEQQETLTKAIQDTIDDALDAIKEETE